VAGGPQDTTVYGFNNPPTVGVLRQRLEADGLGPLAWPAGDLLLHSGDRVVLAPGAGAPVVQPRGMKSHYMFSLGLPLSLNETDSEDLTALPGIGPGLAQAIVEGRRRQRGFRRLEDLLGVPGIGPVRLERIRDHVRL